MINSISVIIPTYNAEATLRRAVLSVLGEAAVLEVLVVDDASTDGTVKVAESLMAEDPRVKVLVQTENMGPAAARNRAVAASSGVWIGLLDADDFILPGRMKGLLSFSDDVDFVADDLYQLHEDDIDGKRTQHLDHDGDLPCLISFLDFVTSNISAKKKNRGELGFIKPIMRRSFLQAHKLRYNETMRLGEDYDLYAHALAAGAKLRLVPAQGYVAVWREGSLSGQHSEHDLAQLRAADERLLMLDSLSLEEKKAVKAHMIDTDKRLQWRLLILAVKNRDFKAAWRCFKNPLPVQYALTRHLAEQVIVRSKKKLGA